MWLTRTKYQELISNYAKPGKILMLFGPRRVGKTTLLNDYLKQITPEKVLKIEGDDAFIHQGLQDLSIETLKQKFSAYSVLAFDEAQKIPGIDMILKRIVDHIPELRIIVTGSSSLDIAQQTSETLTGRKHTITVFPFAQFELTENAYETKSRLESRLIYGYYPQVVNATNDLERRVELENLRQDYLMKDVLEVEGIKNSRRIANLVQLLAYQVGQNVSVNELGEQLRKEDSKLDNKTVSRYLDLLEKSFVIFSRASYNQGNPRKEIINHKKYYFYDLGMRNAVINNFNPLNERNDHDIGALWENYIIVERLKLNSLYQRPINSYFWRMKGTESQELDLVEETGGSLYPIEIKFSKDQAKLPNTWKSLYIDSDKAKQKSKALQIINRNNYMDFISL